LLWKEFECYISHSFLRLAVLVIFRILGKLLLFIDLVESKGKVQNQEESSWWNKDVQEKIQTERACHEILHKCHQQRKNGIVWQKREEKKKA